MIRHSTTFIVGAGGSACYGLPPAAKLRRLAQGLAPGQWEYQLLLRALEDDRASTRLNELLADLQDHPAESVDAFLESRQERPDMIDLGKLVIAALMGVAIEAYRKAPIDPKTDWIGYIIEKMRRGAPKCQDFITGNKVAFVTFNFDTLIEDRLERAVRAIYKTFPDTALGELRETIPIIHVHGQLLNVPAPFVSEFDTLGFPLRRSTMWIREAALNINVILEQIDQTIRDRATAAVLNADRVCFLGFGYDPENLRRIGFRRRLKEMSKIPKLFGSAWGLERGEQHIVKRYFHERIELADRDMDCRQALRFLDVFED